MKAPAGTVLITIKQLEKLEGTARAHDDYLAAITVTRKRYYELKASLEYEDPRDIARREATFVAGYHYCLATLAQATIDATGGRLDEDMGRQVGPSDVEPAG